MIVSVNNLNKSYNNGFRSTEAIKNVSLDIESGDYINIIGRSGSGKSTFLNLLVGFLKPDSGVVKIDGSDIARLNDQEISLLRNTTLGYVPQNSSLLGNLSIIDNVRLPHFLAEREGDGVDRGNFLLQEVGLGDFSEMHPAQLSGGEIRRVLIARALMNQPKLIIADEPTSDLDSETTNEVMDLFTKLNEQGTTLIIVTHELSTLKYGKRVLTMKEGHLG